ncbi:MAG: hypothetical protein WDN50_25810 [Bradyrhizobium sp.]
MALAIELTAGRVEAYGIRRVAELLDSQFSLLWPGSRTAPPRHQTLNATLDWSYNLLSDLERLMLQRLSVFVGGFTLDVAQKIVRTPDLEEAGVYDAIAGLIAKSLVSADMSGPVPRYRLLDTTRTYASAKLSDTGESELLRRRHALCYRDLLQATADQETLDQDQAGTAATDVDNIRASLNWAFGPGGDPSVGVDLAAYSASLWYGKALLTEYRHWAHVAATAETGGLPTQKQLAMQMALASTRCSRAVDRTGYSRPRLWIWRSTSTTKEGKYPPIWPFGDTRCARLTIWRPSTLRENVSIPPGRSTTPD